MVLWPDGSRITNKERSACSTSIAEQDARLRHLHHFFQSLLFNNGIVGPTGTREDVVANVELARCAFCDLEDSPEASCAHDLTDLHGRQIRSSIVEPAAHRRVNADVVHTNEDLSGALNFGNGNFFGAEGVVDDGSMSRTVCKDDLSSLSRRRHYWTGDGLIGVRDKQEDLVLIGPSSSGGR